MSNNGPSQRWGKEEGTKRRYPRLKAARTVLAPESPCDCLPGQCKNAARECRDWTKRATNPRKG